ncbi:MAG TPA: tRNA pseudouridine(38-40) synthase TruA [Polyangiaceae bacterium]|jgi:tRNA pseudouridine38-40 synthase|nr:tRNA pseudouridine(38-40) synthase TruA [Polyangiaceae bacterium]
MSEVSSAEPRRLREEYAYGILLRVAYDGSRYSGLAIQSNAHTIAGELQRAIRTMASDASSIKVCSRTDAGVHARGQYVVFETNIAIGMRGWVLGLGGLLPPDIAVLSAARVKPGLEISKSARQKTYRYSVLQGTIRDPFHESRSWRVFDRLNHERMRAEAQTLLGTHDFRAFRGSADFRTNTVRTIVDTKVELAAHHARLLDITVTGNAFLFNMVRIIAGTLVDVGRGKLEQGAFLRAIESGDRLALGMTAPAAGLFLERIDLNVDFEDEWPYHLDGAPVT